MPPLSASPPPDSGAAARLARCVELFRGDAKEDQKAEFRGLIDVLQAQPLTLRDEAGRIFVNGRPVESAPITALVHRLALHNIAEIAIPAGAPPAEVFELIRAVAAQPGGAHEDIPSRLAAAGISQVKVALAHHSPGPAAAAAPPASAGGMGTEGILRGEPMSDIASSAHGIGVPNIVFDPAPPSAETALPSSGRAARKSMVPGSPPPPAARPPRVAEPKIEPTKPAETTAPPPPVPSQGTPAETGTAKAKPGKAAPADSTLGELTRDPEGPNVGDTLATLGQEVEAAFAANKIERVLVIATTMIQLEPSVKDDSARRHFNIALRRILTKPLLKRVAQLVTVPPQRADAIVVLRRGGADGVEVLLDMLVKSPDVAERRAAFDALRQMSAGTDQVIHMLDHREWFVVRNVAELVGELGLAEAVPKLSKHLGHEDERVRKAAALALAKIGTTGAAEALRRALRDKSAEVRMQVALGVGGRRSSGLAMPLVVALDEEKEENVQRELILALGRIGTPDAVQALIKVSQPSRRLFRRKPLALRIAAVEGLRMAGTAAALGTLEGLAEEGDGPVGEAARAALEDLKQSRKKPSS